MWKCVQCETNNDEQNRYCIICGAARVEQTAEKAEANMHMETYTSPSTAKRSGRKWPVVVAVVALLLAAAAFGTHFWLNSEAKKELAEKEIAETVLENPENTAAQEETHRSDNTSDNETFMFYFYCYNQEDNVSSFIYEDQNEISCFTVDGMIVDAVFSVACDTVVFETVADSNYTDPVTLYTASERGVVPVDCGDFICFELAENGRTLAYINLNYELILYDMDTGTKETVASKGATDLVMSPDGKSLAYNSKTVDGKELLLYRNGEKMQIDKNVWPISLADNGMIYALSEDDNELLMYDAASCIRIADCVEESSITVNRDRTEIMFCDENAIYFSKDGIAKQIFMGKDPYYLRADGVSEKRTGRRVFILSDLPSLCNRLYTCYDGQQNHYRIMYLDQDQTAYFLEEGTYLFAPVFNADWSEITAIYYYDGNGDNPVIQRRSADNFSEVEIIAEVEPQRIGLLSDGNTMYYTDDNYNLWKKEKNLDAERIQINGEVIELFITQNDDVLYCLDSIPGSGADLFCLNEDGSTSLVLRNVEFVYFWRAGLICSVTNEQTSNMDLYASTDGVNFELLVENCSRYLGFSDNNQQPRTCSW